LAQIQSDYPDIEWLELFNDILPEESQLYPNDTIFVYQHNFFKNLGNLLMNTTKRTLANFLTGHRVAASVHFLPESFRKLQFDSLRLPSGVESPRAWWYQCVNVAMQFYPQALGALYVRRFVKPNSKTEVSKIVKSVKDELVTMMKENTWMTQNTRQGAILKAEAMKAQIGYAEEIMNDKKLIEYHKTFPVKIDETRYYESVLKLRLNSINRKLKSFRKPISDTDFSLHISPVVTNAFYFDTSNTIKIPASITNGRFFNVDRPQYMNYGEIGRTIGHEVFHGKF
jgi:predicted metalloendopeptidase